ncbi:EF-hand [Fistulina hepatica ATCC 64428]|uniref:EF-hand n=1 Tax=Fistulina hepatica ATCC 64428 TaxID=1128425 RepID=A0A0D7A5W9_9AGAR|nr:EF-hand [Fistulina hepatica ATCC 64428]
MSSFSSFLRLWEWFSSVDTDRSGQITATELQRALINGDWTPFDLDTVKMLLNIFDTDRSGSIGFNEFAGLWKYIKDWQNVFRAVDRDGSGSIDSRELANALKGFGYDLTNNPYLIDLIQRKYGGHLLSQYGAPPGITFDRFVRACVVVKQLSEAFTHFPKANPYGGPTGPATISYEQFMETVLRLP